MRIFSRICSKLYLYTITLHFFPLLLALCVTEAPEHPVSEEPETPKTDRHLMPVPQAPSIAFPPGKPPVTPQPIDKVC